MANNSPTMARLAIVLGLSASIQPVMASFWTATSRFVKTTSLEPYPYDCTDTGNCQKTYTYTTTMPINSGVIPTVTPTSSYTLTQRTYDLEIVSLYYAAGAVDASDVFDRYATTETEESIHSIDYAVPITYTAPASCPTHFTVVTHVDISVPSAVTDLLKPTSTSTSVWTYTRSSTEYTYLTKFLDPTQLPSTMLPATTEGSDYNYYIASCRNPTATGKAYWGPSGSGSSSGSSSSSSSSSKSSRCDDTYGYRYYSTCEIKTWILAIAIVIPVLFVLGFLESFFWFRRLMRGQSALRLGTVCWCCISLWVACITRSQNSRTLQDQKELAAKWKAIPAGQKFKLWFKWGFRHKYPVELLGNPAANLVQVVTVVVDQNGNPVSVPAGGPVQGAGGVLPPQYGVNGEKGVQNASSTTVGTEAVPAPAPAPATATAPQVPQAPATAHVAGQEGQPGNHGQQGTR